MKNRIIRVDVNPPLYFGPFTKEEAEQASADLQERFTAEVGTYMILPDVNADYDEAAIFNSPDYVFE